MFVGVRRITVAVGAALLLGLTACSSGGSQPRTLPPLSTTPVVSTTSPTASTGKASLAEAKAVVREYFSIINNLSQNMDYRALGELMTPACTCRAQVAAVHRAAEMRQHFVDKAHHLTLSAVADSPQVVEVLVRYDASAGGIVDRSGNAVTSVPAKSNVQRLFRLRLSGKSWRIYEIQSA